MLVILDLWGACLRGDAGQDRVPWAGKQDGQRGWGRSGPQGTGGHTPGSTEHPTTIPRWFAWGAQRTSSGLSEFTWDQTPHNNLSDLGQDSLTLNKIYSGLNFRRCVEGRSFCLRIGPGHIFAFFYHNLQHFTRGPKQRPICLMLPGHLFGKQLPPFLWHLRKSLIL